MKPPDTTILIVEDDKSMRDTLEALLKKEYRIIQTESGKEALKKLKENEIQIALIDIKLPDIRGTEILKAIKREKPDIECIMISVIQEGETIVECMKNGAYDYLTKEFDYDILRHRIENTIGLYYKKRQIRHLHKKIRMLELEIEKPKKSPSAEGETTFSFIANEGIEMRFKNDYLLTEREIEILRLKAMGLRNKEIADKLSLEPGTVGNHIYHIIHKLNLKSVSHAIAFAYEKGILKIPKES